MTIAIGKTFRSGNSEAVRLPKDVAFGRDIELTIVRSGDVVTMYPARPGIEQLIETLAALPCPPEVEARDDAGIPERRGL